ncbi:MAG: DNA recombination protein RmuC [Verrucomicrobiota bacterium]
MWESLLVISILALLLGLACLVFLVQLPATLRRDQSADSASLREVFQKTLGDQKSDFRDFSARSSEQLRREVQESLKNQSLVLEKRFEALQHQTDQRLQEIRGNVEKKLKENFEQNFGAFKEMNQSLRHLKSSADQMLKVSEQVGELNHILASPKLQGNFGETALQQLLDDILPRGSFQWQPKLADGSQPDATITIRGVQMCIDAKFPKDRIAALLDEARDDDAQLSARKELASVVKHMAGDIAKKYIRPELGTADQAFLFVPSERLYFEILKQPELVEHCRNLKVSMVSPNTMGATLYAVALAFRGYEMQENAREMMRSIQKMERHFRDFRSDFEKVGQRIRQAQDDYTKANRDLDRFDKTMNQLKDGDAEQFLENKDT